MMSILWQLQNMDCFSLKWFVSCDKYAPVLLNLIIRGEKRDTMRQSEPRILFPFRNSFNKFNTIWTPM